MEKKEVWSTSDIINNRNNWSLAADAELLKHLQTLSEKIFTQANSTLHSLNSLETDINQTCISVSNTSNKFKALSDTQFIESKILDETFESEESFNVQNESMDFKNEDITVKLKEALENGFQVLDSRYDIIPVSASDSEDDEPQEILLRARNPYLTRRLPYIIGSEDFTRNDNLGLVDTSSSEEEEEDEDEDESEEDTKKEYELDFKEEKDITPKPPPPPVNIEFSRPQTQVIRISSSDSEDSEVSIPSNKSSKKYDILSANKNETIENPKGNDPSQIPYSFADHLNAALKNNRNADNAYNVIPPDFGDSFSPPPFPSKDTNDTSSDDDHSDDSADIFVSKKNTKHSISGTSDVKSHRHDDESDDNDDLFDNSKSWRANEINVISREPPIEEKTIQSSRKSSIISKTSQHADPSLNSSLSNEISKQNAYPTSDHTVTQQSPKPKIVKSNMNPLNKKMVSAINAELNEKLKIKTNPVKSTENITPVKTTKSNKPVTSKPITKEQPSTISAKKEVKEPSLFDELDNTQADTSGDLFSGIITSKPKTTLINKKTPSLFDDDDENIENLFKPSKPTSSKVSAKPQFDDLFPSKPDQSAKIDKRPDESASKPATTDSLKKSNLFGSDSDSEDDLFLLIKNQKKTTPKSTDIFKTKSVDPFKNDSKQGKSESAESNKTQSLFTDEDTTDIFKTKSVDLFKNDPKQSKFESAEGNKTQSLFTDEDTTDIFKTKSVDLFKNDSKQGKSESAEGSKTQSLFTDEDTKNSRSSYREPATDFINVIEKSISADAGINAGKKSDSSPKPNDNTSSYEQTMRTKSSASNIASNKSNLFEDTSKSADSDLFEDNDLFSDNTKPSYDKQTLIHDKIVDVPKSTDLFDDNDTNEVEKCDIADYSSSINPNIQPSDEKFIFETPPDFTRDTSSSNESLDKDSIYGYAEKTDSFNEKDNIFAKNLISKYSSSSEDDESNVTPAISHKGTVSSISEDLFDKKLESEISPNTNKSFGEKLGSPIDDDLFGEISKKNTSKDIKTQSKNLFDENDDDLFEEIGKHSLKPTDSSNKKSPIELPSESIHDEKLKDNKPKIEEVPNEKKDCQKSDTINKNIDSISIKKDVQPDTKPKDDLFTQRKDPVLFNFSKNDLFSNDSDSDEFNFHKNPEPVSQTPVIASSQESTNVKGPSKTPIQESKPLIKEEPSSVTNQIKILNQKAKEIGDLDKRSFSPEKEENGSKILNKNENLQREAETDEQDGNIFTKKDPPEPVASLARSTPGKLAVGRGLKIDVKTLLPGTNWSSKIKQKPIDEPVAEDKPESEAEQNTSLLNNVIKERPKMSGKRRPPSRQARKNRILNNDLFATTEDNDIQAPKKESLFKENKSSPSPTKSNVIVAPTQSKTFDTKSETEKQIDQPVAKVFQVDLFGGDDVNDDDNDLFQTIGNEMKKDNRSLIDEQNKNQTTFVSQSSKFDDELNFEVKPTQAPLLGLTKNRAKPVRRNLSSKKTKLDTPVVIPNEENNPPQTKTETVTEKPNIFEDNPSSSNIPAPGGHTKTVEGLFGDEPSSSTKPASSSHTKVAESLFEDLKEDDDKLFTPPSNNKPASGGHTRTVESLFGDEPLSSTKPAPTGHTKTVESLFEDLEDDDKIFIPPSTKKPASGGHTKTAEGLFGDKLSSSTKPAPSGHTKTVKGLFDDLEDDKIFTPPSNNKSAPSGSSKTVKGLFEELEEDDTNLFSSSKSKDSNVDKPKLQTPVVEKETKITPSSAQQQTKPQPTKTSKIDIFDDDGDDQLFPTSKSKFAGNKLPKKNVLFEDNDDDDDLFGTKSSSRSTGKSADSSSSSVKTKVSNVKPRVVKLRSETVQKDPLTGKDLTSLR